MEDVSPFSQRFKNKLKFSPALEHTKQLFLSHGKGKTAIAPLIQP
jgi:hypothetical protein